MKVTVTGATGTLGAAVVTALLARGEQATVLSRDTDRAQRKLGSGVRALEWKDPLGEAPPPAALAGQDAIVPAGMAAQMGVLHDRARTLCARRCCGRPRAPVDSRVATGDPRRRWRRSPFASRPGSWRSEPAAMGLRSLALGSVSRALASSCSRPVLVVNEPQPGGSALSRR